MAKNLCVLHVCILLQVWFNQVMKEVIEHLARLHGLVHESGKINYTAFAEKAGLPPPTIMRWHKGITKDITLHTAEEVAKAFGVRSALLRGLEPLPTAAAQAAGKMKLSADDMEFLKKFRALPTEDQYEVSEWIARAARDENT